MPLRQASALHTDTGASRTGLYRPTGARKTRRLPRAFANHLRRRARRSPTDKYPRVLLLIDNAPWHAGEPITKVLAKYPPLELKRLPSSSPHLHVSEGFGKFRRRRAPPKRLFDTLADRKRSLRASRCCFQTVRQRLQTLLAECYPRPVNQTASPGP